MVLRWIRGPDRLGALERAAAARLGRRLGAGIRAAGIRRVLRTVAPAGGAKLHGDESLRTVREVRKEGIRPATEPDRHGPNRGAQAVAAHRPESEIGGGAGAGTPAAGHL